MSWERVRAWRDRLARHWRADEVGLSEAGARAALEAATDALSDEALAQAAAIEGTPARSAAIVCASTVSTAPIEWCAVLLGRGTEVTLKVPSERPRAACGLVEAAARSGLPLCLSAAREAVLGKELVVVMGSDATVEAVRAVVGPETRLLGFGHRFSMAWVGGGHPAPDPLVPDGFDDPWGRVAADAALHDGRGCLSPVVVCTSLPGREAIEGLCEAMERAERRWPAAPPSDAEAAAIRARGALAQVTGRAVQGEGWAVHALPPSLARPTAMPRALALIRVPSPADAVDALAPFHRWWSTAGVATEEEALAFASVDGVRTCPLGRMQRPPLDRLHDGVDWLRETFAVPGGR